MIQVICPASAPVWMAICGNAVLSAAIAATTMLTAEHAIRISQADRRSIPPMVRRVILNPRLVVLRFRYRDTRVSCTSQQCNM